jgi:flagellar secretion chaperone FliS
MRHANPLACYQQVATQTATPGQLVLMLYDGAIRFLERALQGFNLEDPGEFNSTIGNNILRAQAILEELDRALDMSVGGEFSARMRGLYLYFDRRLLESNLRKEPAGIQEVLNRLTTIREAWHLMLHQASAPPERLEAQLAV